MEKIADQIERLEVAEQLLEHIKLMLLALGANAPDEMKQVLDRVDSVLAPQPPKQREVDQEQSEVNAMLAQIAERQHEMFNERVTEIDTDEIER